MVERKQHVLIVRGGSWGMMGPGEYETLIETLVAVLGRAKRWDPDTNTDELCATVEVVDGIAGVRARLLSLPSARVVFTSRGMLAAARELKEEYRSVRIFVLTGDFPDDEVAVISKSWLRGGCTEGILLE